jgi:hypothetical protein
MLVPLKFLQLMLGALVVGAMFCIQMGYDPRGLTYDAYVQEHQTAVAGLNVLMPVLGGALILCTLALAYLQRWWKSQLAILILAAIAFLIAGLITRLGNQPINATVMTWTIGSPPEGWEVLREDWWYYHSLRLGVGLAGYALVVVAAIRPQRSH